MQGVCKGKRQLQQRGIDDIEWYLEKRGSRKILPNLEISDLKCLWWVLNSFSGDFWVSEFWFFFWPKGLGGFFTFFFSFGLLESNFSEFTGTANRTGPVDWDRKTRQWRTIHPRRPRGKSLLSSRHLMNKSTFLWLEFLSKHFRPGPSSVKLQVR